ncbi:MAG: hypothetical protein AABX54_05300 [Nanoarchaeota archaeon]
MPEDYKQFVFDIQGFVPPENPKLGAWGIEIILDAEVAIRARKKLIDDKFREKAQEQARHIISGFRITGFSLDRLGKIQNPYDFVEDSLLIRGIRVPGNACDIGLSESSRDDFCEFWEDTQKNPDQVYRVRYTPHNVDNPMQAACLIFLFSYWANTARFS